MYPECKTTLVRDDLTVAYIYKKNLFIDFLG